MPTEIHPTAVIYDSATIGENCVIGPYAVIEEHAVVGDDCKLDSFAQIKKHTVLGNNIHVHSYACVGDEPQHRGYKGEPTRVTIGDNTEIREFVTIHRGTVQGNNETVIGANCILMAYSHVAHDCILGDNVTMANAATLAGHVEVGHHVIISGLSAVQQFARIGEYAFLGGMSGIAQDVPPYMLAQGTRAKLFGPNLIGLKRNGFDTPTRTAIKKAYRRIFRGDLRMEEAMANVEQEFADMPEVLRLVEFLRGTKNGVLSDSNKKSGCNGR